MVESITVLEQEIINGAIGEAELQMAADWDTYWLREF